MKISADEIKFNVDVDELQLNRNLIPVVFLHGFTGSSLEWKSFFSKLNNKYLPAAIDLIGHGETDSPMDPGLYTAESISNQLHQLFKSLQFDKIILCGYSMGARAALSYYSHYPEKVVGLILESSTPGIEETKLRDERIISDQILAMKIMQDGVEKFGNYWLNLPMFEGLKLLPDEEYFNIQKKKIQNNSTGLINSLKSFGTGSMPSLWKKIEKVEFPVLLITGEYDDKFTEINKQMKQSIKNSIHCVVEGCGHNVHLEKPVEFCNLVNKYLSDNFS